MAVNVSLGGGGGLFEFLTGSKNLSEFRNRQKEQEKILDQQRRLGALVGAAYAPEPEVKITQAGLANNGFAPAPMLAPDTPLDTSMLPNAIAYQPRSGARVAGDNRISPNQQVAKLDFMREYAKLDPTNALAQIKEKYMPPPSQTEVINDQLVDVDSGRVLGDYRTFEDSNGKIEEDLRGIKRFVNTGERVFPGVTAATPEYTGVAKGVVPRGGGLSDATYFRSDDPAYLEALQTGMAVEDFRAVLKDQEDRRVAAIEASNQVAAEIQPLNKILEVVKAIRADDDTTDVTGPLDASLLFPTRGFSLSWDNIAAEERIDYLMELAKNVGMQMTRQASPTGSAGGTISEKEWPIMAARIGNLSKRQKDEDFLKELENIELEMTDMISRLQENHSQIYGNVSKQTNGNVSEQTINWEDL